MPIVDIHPHIVSEDTTRYPITPIGGNRSDWSHERSVEFETLWTAMNEAGVDLAAIVHSSTTYGFNCDYVADSVAKHPERLTGVFSINVLEPDNLEKMKYWYGRGLSGMRLFTRGSTMEGSWMAADDERIFPCYAFAAEKQIPVAHNVTVDKFEQIANVCKAFPGVNFVVDHLGKADFTDGGDYNNAKPLFDMAKYPNFYLKLTTKNVKEANDGASTPETLFPKLVEVFGADHIAWGSNYPSAKGTLGEMLTKVRAALSTVSEEDREWILGKTALKLYPVLAEKALQLA